MNENSNFKNRILFVKQIFGKTSYSTKLSFSEKIGEVNFLNLNLKNRETYLANENSDLKIRILFAKQIFSRK